MKRTSLLLVAAGLLFAPVASADDSSTAFFAQGQKLMKEGRFDEACPQFERALALNPGAGTKYNLADCYEKTKRPASALALFREVENVTRQVAQSERSSAAKARADALEPRVPTLVIHAPWAASVPQVTLTLDDKPLVLAQLETPIKVDIGTHVAQATLGDHHTRAEANVAAEGQLASVTLDSPVPPAPPPTPLATTEPPPEAPPSKGTQRVVGYAVAGAGVVATAIGAVLVLGGKSKYDNAVGACGSPDQCNSQQASDANSGRSQANTGGVVLVAGVVAVAAGVVIWLTAPKSAPAKAAAALTTGWQF